MPRLITATYNGKTIASLTYPSSGVKFSPTQVRVQGLPLSLTQPAVDALAAVFTTSPLRAGEQLFTTDVTAEIKLAGPPAPPAGQ
ncbi:hypothetical protein [Streptomyces sp. NPDC023327]|uniref:hypothetical protein n=1 Tax=Streptomyces sp. NPDC023327 TaxID=3157088 RepID=UPI0033FD5063